jgi:endoribonuclease L-PSP
VICSANTADHTIDHCGHWAGRTVRKPSQSPVPARSRREHTPGRPPATGETLNVVMDRQQRPVPTHEVMDNLEVALRAAGAVLTDVVRTTVYVASTDQADLGTAWNVVRARFGDHDAPSTLLGVTVLGYRGQLVEVDAVA